MPVNLQNNKDIVCEYRSQAKATFYNRNYENKQAKSYTKFRQPKAPNRERKKKDFDKN
jgi:hypothetical protein